MEMPEIVLKPALPPPPPASIVPLMEIDPRQEIRVAPPPPPPLLLLVVPATRAGLKRGLLAAPSFAAPPFTAVLPPAAPIVRNPAPPPPKWSPALPPEKLKTPGPGSIRSALTSRTPSIDNASSATSASNRVPDTFNVAPVDTLIDPYRTTQIAAVCDCGRTPPLQTESFEVSNKVSATNVKLGLGAGVSQTVGKYFGTIERRQDCESSEQNPSGHSVSAVQPRHVFVAVSQTLLAHVLESMHSTQAFVGPHAGSGAEHELESRH
jgi:hypothetical protein